MSGKLLWTSPEQQRRTLRKEFLFEHGAAAKPSRAHLAQLLGHEVGVSPFAKVATASVSREVEMPISESQSVSAQEIVTPNASPEATVIDLNAYGAAKQGSSNEMEPMFFIDESGIKRHDIEAIRRNVARLPDAQSSLYDQPPQYNDQKLAG